MSTKGRRTYLCDECKERSMHHWIEKNRAARMRCPACGSARLELVSDEAKQEQADQQKARVEGHRDMSITRSRRKNRKVT